MACINADFLIFLKKMRLFTHNSNFKIVLYRLIALSPYRLIALSLIFSFNFNCADSACEELTKKINKSIVNDEILEDDFAKLVGQFSSKKKNLALCDPTFIANETDVSSYIKSRIKAINESAGQSLGKLQNARFLFENSASMDGYVHDITEYKTTTQNLMVLLKHSTLSPSTLNASIINDEIYPIENFDPESFAKEFTLTRAPWIKGNRLDSDLNQLIKRSLNDHNVNDITFFISDLMYGVNSLDPIPYLPVLKNQVLDTFLTIIKEKQISTIIVKINSKFNGKYYDHKKIIRSYKGNRPFYIVAFATPRILDSFLKEIEIQKLIGYENHIRLDYYNRSANEQTKINYSFFCNSITTGKCDTDEIENKAVKSIQSLSSNGNGEISIPLCANIKESYDIPQSYFTDVNNYDSVEPFKLKILSPNEFKTKGIDKTFIKKLNPDICYLLEGTDIKNYPSTISITLLDRLPSWVADTSIIDDSKGAEIESKTFGFQYFMEGIYAAYQKANQKNANYFNLELKID
jgi:hypothetical protein